MVYINDRHFIVSMSNFKWSHRNALCWNHERSEFNNRTNKPAALTTRFHVTQYHTTTLLGLRGPITCVIKDHCLDCRLTWTSPIKEWTSRPPPPLSSRFQGKPSAISVCWFRARIDCNDHRFQWENVRSDISRHVVLLSHALLGLWWSGCCNVTWPGARHVCEHLASEQWRKTRVERDCRPEPPFSLRVPLLPVSINGPCDFLPVFWPWDQCCLRVIAAPSPPPLPVLIKLSLKISVYCPALSHNHK